MRRNSKFFAFALAIMFACPGLARAQEQEAPPAAEENQQAPEAAAPDQETAPDQEAAPDQDPSARAAEDQEKKDELEMEGLSEEERAAKYFERGRKLYVEGQYLEAITALLKAYELRPAPPILLNIARTYERLDDKKNALKYYKEYLLKARMVDPNRPQVEAMVKKLEQEVGEETGAVTDASGAKTPTAQLFGQQADTGAAPKGKQQLIHTPVDAAKVKEPITIMTELPPRVDVDKVVLSFRQAGEIKFQEMEMERQGEAYVGIIPAKHVTSTSLQYFIEARKAKEEGKVKVVASAGTKTTPNIIVIEGGRAPRVGPREEVDVTSPYRKWMWIGAGVTAAFIGGGVASAVLAADRESAIEKWVDQQSCDAVCQGGAEPKQPFNIRARDWESEGQTFALMGKLFFGLSVATAGATAYLWYLDRQYVKEERHRIDRDDGPRFTAAPWAGRDSAGLFGRVEF